MHEIFKLYLDFIKENYDASSINSIQDYLDWMEDVGIQLISTHSYQGSFPFSFDSNGPESIEEDVLRRLREFSNDYEIDIHIYDIENEIEYQHIVGSPACEWIDKDNKQLGIYAIYEHEVDDYGLKAGLVETSSNLEYFYTEILKNATGEYVDEFNRDEYARDEFKQYTSELLLHYLLPDLAKSTENLTMLCCTNSAIVLDGECGTVYYVLCGYNKKERMGEGWIVEDYIPH